MQGKGANPGKFINMASLTQSWVTHNVASEWLLDDAAQVTAACRGLAESATGVFLAGRRGVAAGILVQGHAHRGGGIGPS
jgi:hypothetical protein